MATTTGPDLAGIALIIVALGTLITAIGGVVIGILVSRVNTAVKTMNESSVGRLASEDETRRIEKIPRPERTEQEQRHVDEAPAHDPPQGPDLTTAVEQTAAIYQAVNGKPADQPSLYEMVATLDLKLDAQDARLDRLEGLLGVPAASPSRSSRANRKDT